MLVLLGLWAEKQVRKVFKKGDKVKFVGEAGARCKKARVRVGDILTIKRLWGGKEATWKQYIVEENDIVFYEDDFKLVKESGISNRGVK